MIQDCTIYGCGDEVNYCVLNLPGRLGHGGSLAELYANLTELNNTVFVGVTPHNFQWYPLPISSLDQQAAVSGLPRALEAIENVVHRICSHFSLTRRQIALAGFSAGGVMAIHTAAHANEPFAGVICHSGAILQPDALPPCRHPDMPIAIFHCANDDCFDWHERYLPMKQALINQGYRTYVLEYENGGHRLYDDEVRQAGLFLASCFNSTSSVRENPQFVLASPEAPQSE